MRQRAEPGPVIHALIASCLFLRQSGLAQAGEISRFDKATDGRGGDGPGRGRPDASDVRKCVATVQPASFGKFGGGAVQVAVERISGGKPGVIYCEYGIGA